MLRIIILIGLISMLMDAMTDDSKATISKGRSPAVVGTVEVDHGGRSPAVVSE